MYVLVFDVSVVDFLIVLGMDAVHAVGCHDGFVLRSFALELLMTDGMPES